MGVYASADGWVCAMLMDMYASVDWFLCLLGWVYVAPWMGVCVYLWMGLFKLHFLKHIKVKSKT